MAWTPGDVSGSQTLTTADHLYAQHINELRTASDSKVVTGSPNTWTAPQTFNAGDFLDKGNLVYSLKAYGAKGDVVTVADGAITTGTNALTSASAGFTSAITGKSVVVQGAGASSNPLCATATYVSATQITLSVNASATVSGATFDYGTDDSTALSNLYVDMIASGKGGVIDVAPGAYFVNNVAPPSTQNIKTYVRGAGMDVSTFKASVNNGFVLKSLTAGGVTGMTIDGNYAAQNALIFNAAAASFTIDQIVLDSVKCRAVKATFGGWTLIVWDLNNAYSTSPYQITNLYMRNVICEQGTSDDLMAITCVDNVFVNNLVLRNSSRSPNFFVIKQLYIDGMYVTNIPNTAAFVIDSQVDRAYLNNVVVDANCNKAWFIGKDFTVTNSRFACPSIIIGVSSGNGPTKVKISNSFTSSIEMGGISGNPTLLICEGVEFAVASSGQTNAAVSSNHSSGSAVGNWYFNNCTFDNTNATQGWLFSPAANVTWSNVKITNSRIVAGTTAITVGVVIGTDFEIKNVSGFNPDVFFDNGTVTGSPAINRLNGDSQKLTLGGNLTPTITSGKMSGDLLRLVLVQDGAGSRTMTWPANFKKAGGTLTLTTTASAVDMVTMVWDGSNWREISRALNVS